MTHHALRNTMIPLVTMIGLTLPTLLSGAVILEQIFTWPGMGRLLFESIRERDYPTIMGLVLMFSVLTLIGQLLADILYAIVDPRVTLFVASHVSVGTHRAATRTRSETDPNADERRRHRTCSARQARQIARLLERGLAPLSSPQAVDGALMFVLFMALVALFAPAIAGTRPIVCKYKGHIYFPRSVISTRLGKPDLLPRQVPPHLPRESESQGSRELGHLAAGLSRSLPPRARRRMARPARQPRGDQGFPNRYNSFGTTQSGRRRFRRRWCTARRSRCLVGFVSMGIAAAIGIVVGASAGYFGGWIDMLLSRTIEVVMCVPTLVLILALLAILEKPTIWHMMAMLGCTGWTSIARLARANSSSSARAEFVTAARAWAADAPADHLSALSCPTRSRRCWCRSVSALPPRS